MSSATTSSNWLPRSSSAPGRPSSITPLTMPSLATGSSSTAWGVISPRPEFTFR